MTTPVRLEGYFMCYPQTDGTVRVVPWTKGGASFGSCTPESPGHDALLSREIQVAQADHEREGSPCRA